MKRILINILFWLYRKDYSKPLSAIDQDILLGRLANTKGMETLPAYLEQCSTNARNKYLYTNDPIFKGSILAYTFLKDKIEKKKIAPIKRDLTDDEKVGIMRGRGY